MKVASFVPSWTETLIEAGVELAGRTRFCIHPADRIKTIPVMGGTKNWDLARLRELKPDLVILDREENPSFMAEQTDLPWWASHITQAADVAPAMRDLASRLGGNSRLLEWAKEWEAEVLRPREALSDFSALPGVIEWGRRPSGSIDEVVYVIWRDPWMRVTRSTFIGSMLGLCGVRLAEGEKKYPEFSFTNIDPARTLLLFSSEPYPFLRRRPQEAEAFAHAYVDGEAFSWFGQRSLRFLQGRR